MNFPKEVLIIVPAKKKSQRLKNKNIKKLNKKPLIAYTFDFIKKINATNQSIVSTDSNEIIRLAKKYNINSILRPKNLCNFNSSIEKAIIHLLQNIKYRKLNYKWILLLQPTSPLRDIKSYKKMLQNYYKFNKTSKFIISLSLFKEDLWVSKRQFLDRVFKNQSRRQQLRKNLYIENGMYYLFEIKNFLSNKNFIGKKTSGFITPKINSIDINDEIDFKITESLINKL